ncbi:AAA family ATPase [uncultured Tateyamaria sp.]|uniref:AAA family ATPase n=1 Tax=Tateyamaria sp. 1078 TaxID=3417464 RepID=UPI00262D5D36|nr:AAA family ATPase [uncultured Tateyamaria sp.]
MRFVLITGCSGGGKSTLLAALAARGYATMPEPGRRIVARARRGQAVFPWEDPKAFARHALAMATADLGKARHLRGCVFFDRGVVDAAVALDRLHAAPLHQTLRPEPAYARTVFVAPPWPRLYARDADRRHSFGDAVAEHDRICAALPLLGYRIAHLPRAPIAARVRFVLARSIAPARPTG